MSLIESLKKCKYGCMYITKYTIVNEDTLIIDDYPHCIFDEDRLICDHLIINGTKLMNVKNINNINILEVNTSNMFLTITGRRTNTIEQIILGKDCKNVNIFGEYNNLKEIICTNELITLNINCNCQQKLTIKNLNIKNLNFLGHYNDFIELDYNYSIDNIIYNDFYYNMNALNIYYNTTFTGNIDKNIETLNICNNCIINGLFDNIKTINIMKECKEVILNGVYNSLININIEDNLNYLELKGNFKQKIYINNKKKYIETLKLEGTIIINDLYSLYINEIIYENFNLTKT